MFRKFATIACTRRWQDLERTNHLFIEFLCKHKISVFGYNNEDAANEEDSSSESSEGETDNDLLLPSLIPLLLTPMLFPPLQFLLLLTEPSGCPQVPDFSKDGLDSSALQRLQTHTILRLVDHSVPNHKIYTILYENCIGEKDSLEASNLNETYQQSSELSDMEKKEVKVLGSNPNGKKKNDAHNPKASKEIERGETVQFPAKLEPDARAVLMRAVGCKLVKAEEKYFAKVLRLLCGHPSHGRISHLFGKAKVGKLTATDMVQLRAIAGNGEAGERGNDMDGDVENAQC
ncbi:hypothetical protein B0H14DRAFT_2582691 [Mycena olivaceomarginata]|nr:hypothetical protein B0H14DRAFT_2582691 [Mycena olivaceomarginata]